VAAVPELGKPPLQKCQFQVQATGGCCSIVGDSDRPKVCNEYRCSWLDGVGAVDDRPDVIGAMFSVNETPRGVIGFAVESKPDAILTTARSMAVEFARTHPMPLVVSEYEKATAGEWVVIRDELKDKAAAILGGEVARLADDVGMYWRKEPV
jgi:hypothetical protein